MVALNSCRNTTVSPQAGKLVISFYRGIVNNDVHCAIEDDGNLMDNSTDNAQIHVAGLG